MPSTFFKAVSVAMLVLSCHAPAVYAQSAPRTAERLHANAIESFRQARFPEAYGRFIALADAGHAPSAEMALWMYANGPSVFGKDWDSTQEQLTSWAQLSRQSAPIQVARVYPRTLSPVATKTRGSGAL